MVSMVLVNLASHAWMAQTAPTVRYWSYVDNLETCMRPSTLRGH